MGFGAGRTMSRKWLESLNDTERAEAAALIERLAQLGCPDPDQWARRELRDHAPQVSRLVLLRHLWSESIDAWRDSLLWIDNLIADTTTDGKASFPEAGRVLRRLIEAGAERGAIAALARFIAYETVFSVVHTLDEGYDPEHEGQHPGWGLIERDPLGHLTGRLLTHLHEDLPKLEPKGHA